MSLKLQCFNLDFHGSGVPTSKTGMKGAIRDMHQVCISEGADGNLPIPERPLTYTHLLNTLREKQLIDTHPLDTSEARADVSSEPVPPPGPSNSSEIVEALTSSHHADVSHFFFILSANINGLIR